MYCVLDVFSEKLLVPSSLHLQQILKVVMKKSEISHALSLSTSTWSHSSENVNAYRYCLFFSFLTSFSRWAYKLLKMRKTEKNIFFFCWYFCLFLFLSETNTRLFLKLLEQNIIDFVAKKKNFYIWLTL